MCGISSKVGVQNLTLASRSLSQCHNKSAEPQPLPSVPARLLPARPASRLLRAARPWLWTRGKQRTGSRHLSPG